MTKTLVALYETVTTAEQVVQELIADGFARSDIHLALDHTKSHAVHNATGAQEAAYEGANLVETLADGGVPYDEAYAYAEGVRRGGALVVVESSEERASGAWRSCSGCSRSTSTSGRRSGSRRAGLALRPMRGQRPPRRPRHPARRGGNAPRSGAWTTRRSGFRWWKKTSP